MDTPDDVPTYEELRTAVQALQEANQRFNLADKARLRQIREWRGAALGGIAGTSIAVPMWNGWPVWTVFVIGPLTAALLGILIDYRADRAVWASRDAGA